MQRFEPGAEMARKFAHISWQPARAVGKPGPTASPSALKARKTAAVTHLSEPAPGFRYLSLGTENLRQLPIRPLASAVLAYVPMIRYPERWHGLRARWPSASKPCSPPIFETSCSMEPSVQPAGAVRPAPRRSRSMPAPPPVGRAPDDPRGPLIPGSGLRGASPGGVGGRDSPREQRADRRAAERTREPGPRP